MFGKEIYNKITSNFTEYASDLRTFMAYAELNDYIDEFFKLLEKAEIENKIISMKDFGDIDHDGIEFEDLILVSKI